MAPKIKLSLPLLLLLVLSVAVLAGKDPDLKQCRSQCKLKRETAETQKRDCEKRCEETKKKKKKKEKENEGGRTNQISEVEGEETEYEEREKEEENPYVFDNEHFKARIETEEGTVRVLPKFTQKSQLLRGIENFRISILEANHSTFVAPSHFDAEIILFVAQGRATVTVIRERRASFELQPGDVFRVPSGAPFYLINKDEREKLRIFNLLQATSIPGQLEVFHGPGGEDPESFYTAFSWELLEAALKVPRDELERFFKQQKGGAIMKASREQIQSLSQHEEIIPRIWPFSEGKTERPFNLFKQSPWQSNKFGHFHIGHPHEFSQLQDLGIAISFADFTEGSMMAPHYNSKAMTIGVVVDGGGGFQMACPHLGRRGQRGESSYQKIRGVLRRDVVIIAPAGHPFSIFASPGHGLRIVFFEINADGNIKYLLAGKENIVNKMERIARGLGFGTAGKEVKRIFRHQEEEFFFPGPTQLQEERGQHQWADA
ncbi:sucrose-binding protein-like isoform X1 [Momordica charantia]|uniref:Sucrose-binding protein-like isoform X1 n=1 Tax=Momordica charantia TaxID=3673 RepID=A0A6J1DAC2_MOMCH|nr:sucrose-binding protein-like isoform X1 [Momordica charantia]